MRRQNQALRVLADSRHRVLGHTLRKNHTLRVFANLVQRSHSQVAGETSRRTFCACGANSGGLFLRTGSTDVHSEGAKTTSQSDSRRSRPNRHKGMTLRALTVDAATQFILRPSVSSRLYAVRPPGFIVLKPVSIGQQKQDDGTTAGPFKVSLGRGPTGTSSMVTRSVSEEANVRKRT